jgi:hypothetical protein
LNNNINWKDVCEDEQSNSAMVENNNQLADDCCCDFSWWLSARISALAIHKQVCRVWMDSMSNEIGLWQ